MLGNINDKRFLFCGITLQGTDKRKKCKETFLLGYWLNLSEKFALY